MFFSGGEITGMSDTPSTAFGLGFCGGLLAGCILCLGLLHLQERAFKNTAIEHGAARYNATSGKFEWIEDEENRINAKRD